MSFSQSQTDYINHELQYQNSGFDAEINARRKGANYCSCACCLGCFGFLFLIALFIFSVWYCIVSGGAELVVSPETTIITEPLKPDGKTVDFHEAVQSILRQDVPPDGNGFRDVLTGYGPEVFAGDPRGILPYRTVCGEWGIDPETPAVYFLVPFEPNNFEQWLALVGEGLDAVHVAAAKPHYFVPLVRESNNDFVIASQPFAVYDFHERLSQALMARAEVRFDSQDIDGAWQDILTAARLFRRVTVNQKWLRALSNNRDESLSLPVVGIVNTLPQWTPEQLEQAVKDLETLPAWQDRQTTLTILHYQLLDVLSSMHALPRTHNRFLDNLPSEARDMIAMLDFISFDWNTVAKELNGAIKTYGGLLEKQAGNNLDEQLEALRLSEMGKPLHMMDQQEMTQFLTIQMEESGDFSWNPLFTSGRSKLAGFGAGVLVTWAAREMYRLQFEEESRVQTLRLALALERYRRENREYPDSLDVLILQPMVPDMLLEYRKQENGGYQIQNSVFEMRFPIELPP